MDYEKLKTAARTITMPDETKCRIARNCRRKIAGSEKEMLMEKNQRNRMFGKPAAMMTVLAIFVSLTVTAGAASGRLAGFFRDITDHRGAVVGTSYEQATDEIRVTVAVDNEELTVLAAFTDPQRFPYREAERLGIGAYKIVDAKGNAVKEGTEDSAEVVNGQALIRINIEDLDSGSYKLMVTAFVAEKKADQPMRLNGSWECGFIR